MRKFFILVAALLSQVQFALLADAQELGVGGPVLTLGQWVHENFAPEQQRDLTQALAKYSIDFEKVQELSVLFSNSKDGAHLVIEGSSAKYAPQELIYIGAQVGVIFMWGVEAVYRHLSQNQAFFDLDLRYEPSDYLRALGGGAQWHPWNGAFWIGGRLRYLRWHPGSSRGYDPEIDNQWGYGPELGFRWQFAKQSRGLATLSLGMIQIPKNTVDLAPIYTLNIGVALKAIQFN